MKNILTVDLEDWFSVETFGDILTPENWETLKPAVEYTTEKIIALFRRKRVKATFFVLGWIADHYPDLIKLVVQEGHEIACHSYHHRMVSSLSPDGFRRDTEMALEAINNACGVRPIGYRSPSWGIKAGMDWAFEILIDLGFKYDSSIFPIRHDIYGDPAAPRDAYQVELKSGQSIIEIPASTVMILGRRFPIGGGGWLRQFPYWFTRWGIRKINSESIPAVVYFHPWELETNIPRLKLSFKNRIRQYGGLSTMEIKVKKLLDDFDFITLKEYTESLKNKNQSNSI